MSDIAERLRNWRTLHLTRLGALFDEAADEIERLLHNARGYTDGVSADGKPKATLTDAEREAVERACRGIASTMPYESQQGAEDYETLRGLLERLK